MIKISFQTDSFILLKEILNSNCDGVRYGSEICELTLPPLNALKRAYNMSAGKGKEFTLITPRLPSRGLNIVKDCLDFLDKKNKNIRIVLNDIGLLNLLTRYNNLEPHLGRQLIYIPSRCPWPEIVEGSFFLRQIAKRYVAKIFHQTSLNYSLTVKFFQKYKVKGADVDWIPKCFPYYAKLVESGFKLSIYIYLIPVTLTRKCHLARLIGEKRYEKCSKPCKKQALILENKALGIKMLLLGNAVFKIVEPNEKDLKSIRRIGISEIVISLNPYLRIANSKEIDEFILKIHSML